MKELDREVIDVQLFPEERSLLLKYGYPFERIEQALKHYELSKAIEIVPLDCLELGHMIGDLCYSINKRTSGRLQAKLVELCDRLEAAERYGDGMLDVI